MQLLEYCVLLFIQPKISEKSETILVWNIKLPEALWSDYYFDQNCEQNDRDISHISLYHSVSYVEHNDRNFEMLLILSTFQNLTSIDNKV